MSPDFMGEVDRSRKRIVDFGRRVVAVPSLSGEEEELAQVVLSEMRRLEYDQTEIDAAGNVIGRVDGGDGPTVMLHAHMDVVEPGDVSAWTHPPFGGEVAGGWLWGRGAADTKGCLIAQVYALGLLREMGLEPAGDVIVAAVVGEEQGGYGTRHLIRSLKPDVAIVGEPSANALRRGHRGRYEFVITWHGRAAHASAPERGRNPHYSASRFLLALRDAPMTPDDVFGGTTVAPTLSYVHQSGSNIIPAALSVHLDWRTVPAETLEEAQALLRRILDETLEPDVTAEINIRTREITTYTGMEREVELVLHPFLRSTIHCCGGLSDCWSTRWDVM